MCYTESGFRVNGLILKIFKEFHHLVYQET